MGGEGDLYVDEDDDVSLAWERLVVVMVDDDGRR